MQTVTKVSRIPCRHLTATPNTPNPAALDVRRTAPWEEVCTQGPAKLQVTAKMDTGQLAYTAKLTFTALHDLDSPRRCNYRLTLSDGTLLLLAPAGRPYPTVAIERTLPDSPKSTPLPEYTVEITASTPPMPIASDELSA